VYVCAWYVQHIDAYKYALYAQKKKDASEKSLAAAAFPHGTRQQACNKPDGSLAGEEMEAYARGGQEAGTNKKLGVEGSMHEKEKGKTACDSYFLSIGALVSRKLDLVPPVQRAVKVISFFLFLPSQPFLPLPSLFLYLFTASSFLRARALSLFLASFNS
jgi:hypothetical protein